jgi:electron transport complex protein RnfE
MSNIVKEFTKGLWAEIPPFRFVLGLCPTLAVTKTVETGVGMGLMLTFVLVFSNIFISSLRKIIPPNVRIACFIVTIATFVVIVELVSQAYTYPLYQKLGIFIPLIVVNCIVLGRAEAFASKNGVVASIADGLGMGIGFTISLTVLSAIRELFGAGTLYGIQIMSPSYEPFTFMVSAPGAFVCLGLILCIINLFGKAKEMV